MGAPEATVLYHQECHLRMELWLLCFNLKARLRANLRSTQSLPTCTLCFQTTYHVNGAA